MSREPHRTARSPRPRRSGSAGAASAASLIARLAHTDGPGPVLPHLHQEAIERAGGACSLLFQYNPRNGALHPTSGFGLDLLPTDAWLPDFEEAAVVSSAFDRLSPLLVPDAQRRAPDLAARLGAAGALLIPLVRGTERVGLLAVGFRGAPPAEVPDDVAEVGSIVLVALELFQMRLRDEWLRDLRALFDEFSATLSRALNLAAGLDSFCHGANLLFGADRTSVWLHDRRARQLVLQASSDIDPAARGIRVGTADGSAPAAVAMRGARAEIVHPSDDQATVMVTVPLRGRRRALGTVVFENARMEPGGDLDLLDRADELGRQLSSAVENMELLDSLMQSRRELEDSFDSIAHLVLVADRQGRVTHVNQSFAARVGRARDAIVDRPLAELVGPELAGWVEEHRRGGRGGRSATREVVDQVLDGPFTVTVTDLLNHDREHVGSVVVARDLTPQARLEAEKEELRSRLTQSEKLAALGQFVAGIAHELNNPLQGVLGHLELLGVTGAFPRQIRREVQTIYREAERAAKIVRNLLVFAGSHRMPRRLVSVNAVLQKVLALRAGACRALGIELVRHYDEKLPRVHSDPLLLHQVFLNMVMNAEHAIAAVGRGGRIEVATAAAAGRKRVVVTLRDTGTGIADDALPRIFEPFYTTKEVGKGTGLGLAIAYGIVQEHGGHISAANHPEGGAVFTVELPTATPPARGIAHDG